MGTKACGLDDVFPRHYDDVIMSATASQITSLTIVYSTVYPGADQNKHQSSASLAFVRGIHRGPVNSSHKWPVTRKMFPFDDVIMVMASGLVLMLGMGCVVCNNPLFFHSFNNFDLIFTCYSSVTSWCVLSETTSAAVNGSLYTFCLYGLCVHFAFFLTPAVVDIQLLPQLNEFTHLSEFFLHLLY